MRARLDLDRRDAAFRPGERVIGTLSWHVVRPPSAIEVRLVWRTHGKGTTVAETAARAVLRGLAAEERRPFEIMVPAWPYTYHGSLFAILWTVEAVVPWRIGSGEQIASAQVLVSPTLKPMLPPTR